MVGLRGSWFVRRWSNTYKRQLSTSRLKSGKTDMIKKGRGRGTILLHFLVYLVEHAVVARSGKILGVLPCSEPWSNQPTLFVISSPVYGTLRYHWFVWNGSRPGSGLTFLGCEISGPLLSLLTVTSRSIQRNLSRKILHTGFFQRSFL